MSCFKCFGMGGSVDQAATTIGRYYRGNAARGERKRLEARKHLQITINKVTVFQVKPRAFKVTDDELGMFYSKPGTGKEPQIILFADMTSIALSGAQVVIALKGGKTYTFQTDTVDRAKNFYTGLAAFVDAKIMRTPIPTPKKA
ncbi:hypothetical protein KFE25_000650 [Diacronema lutheri]|uniref:Uncharacterized protein n=2 Tax=Diacronema lutheri TaxID=2081491 RepID=A0A8J6CC98_DIALT|nr:hypothetical protein KFE25_000650 [Diacronema lutheri]